MFAGLPVAASADSAPTVESETASHVTAIDATLEATIDPQGAEHGVYYQFQLLPAASELMPPAQFECPTVAFPAGSSHCLGLHSSATALPIGRTHSDPSGETVHLDLLAAGVKLQPAPRTATA